ncbi:MAG: cytochrome c oxidase accessory protein CcoG, partial [Oceanicaulis sp.]|nr:cytochrome c oxidase accessory protein CcoG [Oceanicaulis sp.]
AGDHILDKGGGRRGLIAYSPDDKVVRRQAGEAPRLRFIRPRIVLYAALIAGVCAIMLTGLVTREELGLHADRDRNPNYVILSDGSVRNAYTLNVQNKARITRRLDLTVAGDGDLDLQVLGARGAPVLEIGPDRTRTFQVFLTLPRGAAAGHSIPVVFAITDPATGEIAETRDVFVTGAAP